MKYLCTVCGYDQLRRPPKNYHICPCCGTEFGNDDFDVSHEMLRSEWVARGMGWFSRRNPAPANWSPVAQLRNIGYGIEATEKNTLPESVWIVAAMRVRIAGNVPLYATKVITKIVRANNEVVAVGTLTAVAYDGNKDHAGSRTAFYGQSLCPLS